MTRPALQAEIDGGRRSAIVKAATARRHAESDDLLTADVGQRIREARQARGLSLSQLGGEDLSRSFLSLVENGRSRVSLRALAIIADRLELPISYFLSGGEESPDLMAALLLQEAEIALGEQRSEEALRLLNEAEETARTPLGNQARFLRARLLLETDRAAEAMTVLRAGIADLDAEENPYTRAQFRYLVGATLYRTGAYDEAEIYLREALDEAVTHANDPVLTGKITVCIGHIAYVRQEIDRAIAQYRHALELFGEVRDFHTQATVYSGLSLAFRRQGDMETALEYARLSAAMYRASNDVIGMAQQLNNMAVAFEEQGDLDQAMTLARQALARAEQLATTDLQATVHNTLASIHFDRGDVEGAAREAQTADRLAPDDQAMSRLESWRLQAQIADERGDHERADTLYQRALDGLRETGRKRAYAETALAYSAMLESRGDTSQALRYALEAARVHVGVRG